MIAEVKRHLPVGALSAENRHRMRPKVDEHHAGLGMHLVEVAANEEHQARQQVAVASVVLHCCSAPVAVAPSRKKHQAEDEDALEDGKRQLELPVVEERLQQSVHLTWRSPLPRNGTETEQEVVIATDEK